jgi:hypothetical protein
MELRPDLVQAAIALFAISLQQEKIDTALSEIHQVVLGQLLFAN